MARTTLLGSAMNFAHLLGRPGARAEEDKPKDEKDEKDKDAKGKTKAEEGDEDEDETEEEKRKRRDDEDEQDEERREEDEEDKEERRKREDEEDEADAKDAKATAARRRERARCAAIFASKHAAARPDMAAHLAFGTDMTRKAARNTLAAIAFGTPAPAAPQARSTIRDRMQERRSPQLGNDGGADPAEDTPDAVARRNLAAAGIAVPPKK